MFVLLAMMFCHIVDDYYLQGWLASAKQKEWWKKNAPDEMYKNDYIWALLMHSFSWSFMVMLPIAIANKLEVGLWYYLLVMINTVVHCVVDDLKANQKEINLWVDQIIHFVQIFVTYIIYSLVM